MKNLLLFWKIRNCIESHGNPRESEEVSLLRLLNLVTGKLDEQTKSVNTVKVAFVNAKIQLSTCYQPGIVTKPTMDRKAECSEIFHDLSRSSKILTY